MITMSKKYHKHTKRFRQPSNPVIRSTDFQFIDGKLVATKEFLLKQGTCCKNNCQNCPYNK